MDASTAPPTPESLDALLPPAIARRAETVGVAKAALPIIQLVPLAVLAGAFIALGAVFSTAVTADPSLQPGIARLLAGLTFSLGLVLVVIGGAELFTGNTMIVMAWASRRVTLRSLLRNWSIVYLGNLFGALSIAVMVSLSGRLDASGGSIGTRAIEIGEAKASLGFVEATVSGVLANVLVCLAVWMSWSARTVIDRIAAVVLPVTAFVAAGFEHSVANMYFLPAALIHRSWAEDGAPLPASPHLSWSGFVTDNLVPVTVGNIIGGGVLVAGTYWFVYLRGRSGS
jgi:formate transporter